MVFEILTYKLRIDRQNTDISLIVFVQALKGFNNHAYRMIIRYTTKTMGNWNYYPFGIFSTCPACICPCFSLLLLRISMWVIPGNFLAMLQMVSPAATL